MAEFLLELFSEEIPAKQQSAARINLLTSFKSFFEKENINYKDDAKVFSTPNRLVLCFKKIAIENNFKISISHTTRKPRSNEENGKDYYFVSENEFTNFISSISFKVS